MSREYILHSSLEEVEVGNRESLLGALINISDFDLDFIGENGVEYLWDEVWEANGFQSLTDYEYRKNLDNDGSYEEIKLKYESNLAWLLDEVKNIEDDEDCANAFFEEWINNDMYYDTYTAHYLTDSENRVIAIGFATICGW